MSLKWYVSTLFLIICISFGAFQEQGFVPNQEIVLEFVDTKINKNNIENTIANVKEKLLNVGVSNISIKDNQNGTLKIAYYSSLDVKNIKEALADENQNLLSNTSNHKKEKDSSSDYNIDVYELTQEKDISNSKERSILNTKYSSNRFTTNSTYASLFQTQLQRADFLFKTAYKTNKNNPFTKDNSSYKEPEVRAGPHNYA
jgi:Skp family chaperone for outer membrane proteins